MSPVFLRISDLSNFSPMRKTGRESIPAMVTAVSPVETMTSVSGTTAPFSVADVDIAVRLLTGNLISSEASPGSGLRPA